MAGRQRHLVHVGRVPCRDDVPARSGFVRMASTTPAIWSMVPRAVGPASPLAAIDRAEIAVAPAHCPRCARRSPAASAHWCRRAGTTKVVDDDLRCSFLVVSSGKPAPRSKRIWWPNSERAGARAVGPVDTGFGPPQQVEIGLLGLPCSAACEANADIFGCSIEVACALAASALMASPHPAGHLLHRGEGNRAETPQSGSFPSGEGARRADEGEAPGTKRRTCPHARPL